MQDSLPGAQLQLLNREHNSEHQSALSPRLTPGRRRRNHLNLGRTQSRPTEDGSEK
jgi:hypothetical protein